MVQDPDFRLAAKEIAVLLMQPSAALELDVPSAERRARSPWAVAKGYAHYSRRFLNWLSQQGISSLAEVAQRDADAFLKTISPESRNTAVKQVRLFAAYGDVLTTGGFAHGFRPWGAASDAAAAGKKVSWGGANKTPPIPDDVYGRCVADACIVLETVFPAVREAVKRIEADLPLTGPGFVWPLGGEPTKQKVARARTAVEFAATLLVCALTGMRATEVSAIKRGSVGVEELDENLRRYKVRSYLLKGTSGQARVDTWLISETAANALSVLEQLSSSDDIVSTCRWGERYTKYLEWVEEHRDTLAMTGGYADLRITPRHFRRTVAVAISRQQNGLLAAKSHLKHASILTTEGYAAVPGGAAATLMRAADQERILMNESEVERIVLDITAGRPVSGLGASLLRREIDAALEEHRDTSGRVLDSAAAKQLSRKYADIVHIGSVSNCWFRNPEQARCLAGEQDKSKPRLSMCEPARCVNATVHEEQAGVWMAGLEEIQRSLMDKRVPEGEKARLRARAKDMADVLGELKMGDANAADN